jgi:hypothetical protein
MCVLVYSCFIKNPLTWSWLTAHLFMMGVLHPPSRLRHKEPYPLYHARWSEVPICLSTLPLHRTHTLTPSPPLLCTMPPTSCRTTPPQAALASIPVRHFRHRAVPQSWGTAHQELPLSASLHQCRSPPPELPLLWRATHGEPLSPPTPQTVSPHRRHPPRSLPDSPRHRQAGSRRAAA